MPELPRYQQKQTLPDTRPTGTPVDPNQATRVTREVGNLAKTVGAANEVFMKMKMKNEVNQAKIKSAQSIFELEQNVADNPSEWDSEKVSIRLEEIKSESGSNIGFQISRDEFEQNFGLASIGAQTKTASIMRKHQIDQSIANYFTMKEQAAVQFANALPAQRQIILNNLEQSGLDLVRGGVFDADIFMKANSQVEDEFHAFAFQEDLRLNPEMALKNAQSGAYGRDPMLRQKFQSEAEKAVAKREKEGRELYFQQSRRAEGDVFLEYVDTGNFTKTGIDVGNLSKNKTIQSAFTESMKAVVDSKKTVDSVRDPEIYNKLSLKAFSVQQFKRSDEEAEKVMNEALMAHSEGKLTRNDLKEIGWRILPEFQADINEKIAAQAALNEVEAEISNFERLSKFFGDSGKAFADMTSELIQRLKSQSPMKLGVGAANKVANEIAFYNMRKIDPTFQNPDKKDLSKFAKVKEGDAVTIPGTGVTYVMEKGEWVLVNKPKQ